MAGNHAVDQGRFAAGPEKGNGSRPEFRAESRQVRPCGAVSYLGGI